MDARNPTGINSQTELSQGYGDVTKLKNLTAAAPVAQNPQRQAPQVAPPEQHLLHPPPDINPDMKAAIAWAKIAAIPGASQDVIDYAQKAARMAGS